MRQHAGEEDMRDIKQWKGVIEVLRKEAGRERMLRVAARYRATP